MESYDWSSAWVSLCCAPLSCIVNLALLALFVLAGWRLGQKIHKNLS